MEKLTEKAKVIKTKWNSITKGKKVAIISAMVGIILIIIYLGFTVFKTKYSVLFSELDPKDSGSVIKILKEDKVPYKVQGDSILVPQDKVSMLKMEMLSKVEFSNGSKGLELFDSSSMVSTEFENNVKYQKALQGEIERMIKSFDEVKDCKVILKLPEKETFAIKESTEQATSAIYIKLKPGVKELKQEQAKAVVSLVTGAVPNLPRENVNIAVNDMKLVTEDLFDEDGKENNGSVSNNKQQQIIKQKEEALKNNVLGILEPIYGKGVKVAVNASLNFDAVQTESKNYTQGVVVSEHEIKSSDKSNGGNNVTSSPVDNNLSNTQQNNNNTNSGNSDHSEITKNYNVPEVNKTEIQAPGKVEKINIAVTIDESNAKLDDYSRQKIEEAVSSAVGLDADRGDTISIQGFKFKEDSLMDSAKSELEKSELQSKKVSLEKGIAIAIAAIILLIIMLVVYKKVWDKEDDEEEDDELETMPYEGLESKEKEENFQPIVFETQTQNSHMESQVKKYAQNKPEQVADIIKSWLAEDER